MSQTLTEQDRIMIALDKICKNDRYRMSEDNAVFAKALMFLIKQTASQGVGTPT